MFENYKATQKDFEAVEEGIKTVWKKELGFIFAKKDVLSKTSIISFDSRLIYLWSKQKFPGLKQKTTTLSGYYLYQIPHRVSINDIDYHAWYASILKKGFYKFLPRFFTIKSQFACPRISGGLLTPFIALQKKKKIKDNPYTTRQSFLATIVHEFGHVYWSQHKLWWYSNKKDNLNYLTMAKQLYEKKKKIPKISLYFPVNTGISELFATCTEYRASELFWPNHKKNFNTFVKHRLEELIKIESKKNLEQEDSVLEPGRNPHDFAFVFGKIILSRYPRTWPEILTQPQNLFKIYS